MTTKTKTEKTVIVIRESNLESFIQDGTTFAMLLAIILISNLLNSQAVGWVGAILFFLAILTRWAHSRAFFTVDEARAELDRIEAKIKEGK